MSASRFTISLKRSTQNLQLSTSWPADYPISNVGSWGISGRATHVTKATFMTDSVEKGGQ